jgi:hypothetical protein
MMFERFCCRGYIYLLLSLALLFSGIFGCAPTLGTGVVRVVNGVPFQHTVACKRCHEGEAEVGKPSLRNPDDPSVACKSKRCHGRETAGNHHPSSTEPGPFGTTGEMDPAFKLYEGKMECLTCHQVHSGDDYSRGNGTKYFLAGGPYRNRREICSRCHNWEEFRKINPHNSMIDEESNLDYGTCLMCHATSPDPNTDGPGDVRFRASIPFLCWRCHSPMGGKFFWSHFLKEPAQRMQDKKHLLLDYKGRVTCSSCHNPHQPGVIIYGVGKKGAGKKGLQRFGIQMTPDFCYACHIR